MTKVHQCDLWGLSVPTVQNVTGELVEVAGEQMVRMSHGAILPLGTEERWHGSLAAAKRHAAQQVDGIIVTLHGLAARLRAEADAEDARGGAA
jgi:hypothetical protein